MLLLIKQLHAAMRAGYNIAQALDIAMTQSKGRLGQILLEAMDDVKKGAYLHEALGKHEKYFPPLFINLIKTGELSGSLKENLKRLAAIIEREQDFRQKFRSAMIYPIFVLVAIVGLGLAIAIFVLPNLLPLFKSLDVELPLSTQVLLWFAELFDQYGLAIFVSTITAVVALAVLARRRFSRPVTHWLLLKTPLIGKLVRQLVMARFGRALASLLRSGIPIDESLKVTATVITNYYYQRIIKSILPHLQKGQTLAGALERHSQFFDDIFIKLLALGESTAGLEESCDNVAEYFEGEVDESMKNLTVALEPLLIIFVGVIVAFVALSIIGPIYKITGSIR